MHTQSLRFVEVLEMVMVLAILALMFVLIIGGKSEAVMIGTPTNPIYDKVFSLLEGVPGAVLTSWCRSKEYNRSVGGVEGSRHIACMAVDVVVPQDQTKGFIARAESLGFKVLVEADHIHLEYRR